MTGIRGTLSRLKAHVRSATADQFWLRYSTLAAYRAMCAAASSLTGFTTSGAAHADRNESEAVGYIVSVFDKYKSASGLDRFHGKVAEIGPGDSCGIGLMFLADGCTQVDLVDRFYSERDEAHQQSINREIVKLKPALATLLHDDSLSEKSFSGMSRHYGQNAAAETFFENNQGYDFIVSCAVLEHVYDPLRAIKAASAALNPGGMLLHQIDCRDHGQFSTSFHELKFLEIPVAMYSPLKWGGGPNRVRLSAYIGTLNSLPLDYRILVTSLAGVAHALEPALPLEQISKPTLDASREFVNGVRGRFAAPFRDMPIEDLMVTSFMIVAKRTG
jgi:SAM-dependent methyltransferase